MKTPVIISIGGGKGGVGKSTITANIGAMLSRSGATVGFIDADLGGANLHLCLGVKRPRTGLHHFLSGAVGSLKAVAVETPIKNTWLISGASDILELANPNFGQKQKIITNLRKMSADYILVDLGAGADNHVTDFYAAFPFGIIVMDSLPTSVENAYGFLKNGTLRGLLRLFPGAIHLRKIIQSFTDPSGKSFSTIEDLLISLESSFVDEVRLMREWIYARKIFLVINMVNDNDDIEIGRRFMEIVKKYLSLRIQYIGYVVYSPEIRASIKEMRPAIMGKDKKVNDCFDAVTRNLLVVTKGG